jgi:hypothetical protein
MRVGHEQLFFLIKIIISKYLVNYVDIFHLKIKYIHIHTHTRVYVLIFCSRSQCLTKVKDDVFIVLMEVRTLKCNNLEI